MRVTVIIPTYNEIKTLPEILDRINDLSFRSDCEVIVVDDGSEDETFSFLNANKNSYDFSLIPIRHSENMGKGAAVSTAIARSSGEYVIIQDADLEYHPSNLENIYKKIFSGHYDVVFGSRFLSNEAKVYSYLYLAGNKFLTFCIKALFLSKISDSYTCYKAFKSDVAKKLNLSSNGFEVEAEMSCKVANRKYSYAEIPISYEPRSRENGKKINFKDAVRGFLKIVKLRIEAFKGI